jgi:hypothetical protein
VQAFKKLQKLWSSLEEERPWFSADSRQQDPAKVQPGPMRVDSEPGAVTEVEVHIQETFQQMQQWKKSQKKALSQGIGCVNTYKCCKGAARAQEGRQHAYLVSACRARGRHLGTQIGNVSADETVERELEKSSQPSFACVNACCEGTTSADQGRCADLVSA